MPLSPATTKLLANAYVDMVDLFKAGEIVKARAVQEWVAEQLTRLVVELRAEAEAARAAGHLEGALAPLGDILVLHARNLTQIELPLSRPDCYREIAQVLHAMDLPVAARAAAALATRDGDSLFKPPDSCQIPILGGLYEALFGSRTDGTFVEVGAFDGETYSNTSCLADLGWHGLYIEPVGARWWQCRERHRRNPRVSTLNCAIGPEAAMIRLWESGPKTSGSPLLVDPVEGRVSGDAAHAIEVPQMRLDTAMTEAGIAPGFDLLVVDVEGMEEQVFASFVLEEWRPVCMIVELTDHGPARATDDGLVAAGRRVRAAIAATGYDEVYRDATNTVFQRRPAG
ncbi:MAG: FkbM family methyltransferase [Alphaproteobacteria bacterium]|nr:FkbM family methyltransferase [Alphaproteobacteria bacterium]